MCSRYSTPSPAVEPHRQDTTHAGHRRVSSGTRSPVQGKGRVRARPSLCHDRMLQLVQVRRSMRYAGVQEIPADNVQLAPPNTEHREDTLSGAALLGLRDRLRRTGLGTTAARRLGARVGFADLLEGE